MTKYRVQLSRKLYEFTYIDVEATRIDDAIDKALEKADEAEWCADDYSATEVDEVGEIYE